jgi:outer membrane lipase/esterase
VQNSSFYPNGSGTPFSGAVGVDFMTPSGVIVGAATSAGDAMQNFSTGGQFRQVDEALSVYAAYRTGPLWGNAVASYDLLQDHVERQVQLGVFNDQNSGDANGHDLGLALRGGWELHVGPVTTGPVVGFVWQQAYLNGFTEAGETGFTALSFGAQTRNSAVSQLGWRGSIDVGAWQPFAEVDWNHEWAGGNRSITASLVSVAAPSYTSPAVPVAQNWASASLGLTYKLNAQVFLRAAVEAVMISPQVGFYGGELGANVSFQYPLSLKNE